MLRNGLLLSVACLYSLCTYAQDTSGDRWVDSGDETRITLPTSETGRVVITKDNPGLGGFNEFLRIQPTHSTREYIGFRNGTTTNSFVPVLLSYSESNAGSAMVLAGVTNPTYDFINSSPMLLFDTRTHGDNTLSTGGGSVNYRPLFAWRNYTTVHMQMLANGSLGLGTTTPQAQFHTTGSVRFAGLANTTGTSVVMADANGNLSRLTLPLSASLTTQMSSTSNAVPKFNSTGTLQGSQLTDDGVGVGVGGAPVAGSKLTLYGTLKLMSDARTKTNVVRLTGAIQKINALNGYYYDWKGQVAAREVGFLAQEVEQVLPEAVSENSEGVKFLNYDGVMPVLTEAIKEQQRTIEVQNQTIGQLTNLVEQLRLEVNALKQKR